MTIELDPRWEYWVPDPEVAEAIAGPSVGGFALLDDDPASPGVRFGRGDPDWFAGRLASPKPEPERRPVASRPCAGCGVPFTPDRHARRHCSRACAGLARRGKRHCRGCGRVFHPKRSGRRFCSPACAAPFGAPPRRVDVGAFRAGYLAGERLGALAARLGVTQGHCKRLRRQLGLPARRPGRPKGGRP